MRLDREFPRTKALQDTECPRIENALLCGGDDDVIEVGPSYNSMDHIDGRATLWTRRKCPIWTGGRAGVHRTQ